MVSANRQIEQKHSQENDVLSEAEAAKFVKVCSKTLRKLRKDHRIPHAHVGARIIYLRSQLHVWLQNGGANHSEAA